MKTVNDARLSKLRISEGVQRASAVLQEFGFQAYGSVSVLRFVFGHWGQG